MHPRDQTIFALSTGPLPSAIAIVRVSGPKASEVLSTLTGCVPPERVARRVKIRDAAGEPIDDAVVLWLRGPATATGEDVAEFQIHGSRAVLAALIKELSAFDGVRGAEPGEFTRRAFENGKLDLTEAEGLDDLIHADTEAQRRQALRQLGGLLGDKARGWRQRIIEAAALVEAGIDFSDEGDVAAELMAPALARISELLGEIVEVLAAEGRGERLRDGLVVAISGPPNVGKSTLINRLARREVAIVSPHAGTTRDVIEVRLDLGGFPVTVIDTAGIRDSDDPVEREGVRRAIARAAEADLVLWLGVEEGMSQKPLGEAPVWWVRNKVDLEPRVLAPEGCVIPVAAGTGPGEGKRQLDVERRFQISAARGDGLEGLVKAIGEFASAYFGQSGLGLITRARHRELLQRAADMLRRSMTPGLSEELVAEELRGGVHALGRLVGRVDVEDVLGEIFGRFCIGK